MTFSLFLLKDSKQIPNKTLQEKTAESSSTLRLLFPVSSGQQHRKTGLDKSFSLLITLIV